MYMLSMEPNLEGVLSSVFLLLLCLIFSFFLQCSAIAESLFSPKWQLSPYLQHPPSSQEQIEVEELAFGFIA